MSAHSRLRLGQALRLVLLGAVAAVALIATANARASGTVTIGAGSGFSLSGATYSTAESTIGGAVSGGNALDLPLSIPDLQQMPVSNVSFSSDATSLSLALQGNVTLKGQGVSVQLSAVWDSASSTAPHIAVAVKPTDGSLQALNAIWASAPVNPTLTSALLVASPSSGYSFDPTRLPAAAQAFYPHLQTLSTGPGLTLSADVDASTDQNLSNALHYLGEGTAITVRGTLSGSVAPLFGGASAAQESGLDLSITVSGGSSLPSWISARTSSAEFKLTGTTPAVTISDDITTNLNGKVNEFAGTLSYDAGALDGPTVDFKYGLKSGTLLQIPFGLDSLTLSNPQLELAMTTGPTRTFSGTLDTDATAGGTTVHLNAGITAGGGGTVSATFGITGPITVTDAVNFADNLLGLSVPTSGFGTDVSLNSLTFSFTRTASSQTFSLDANATVRSLAADVLLSIRHTAPDAPKLIIGLHLSDAGSTCNCITLGKLLGGSLSDLAGGLQLPAVDVYTSLGFGNASASVDVPTASLSSVERGFFQHVLGTLPSSISFGPKLSLSASLTVPDAVASTFGMAQGAQVILSGDLGFGLDAFGGSSAPALGAVISAQLPPFSAGLPSWLSSSGDWTLTLGVSSNTVQLGVDGSIDAVVQGVDYPITVSGMVSKSGSDVGVSISGGITGTISNVFGLSWLSVTDPTVSLSLHHGSGSTTFDGELDADITVGPATAHVAAAISKGDGTEASLTVTSTTPLSSTDVASFFGIDLSGVSNMPALTLNSLVVRASATAAAKSLDVVANTTLTVNGKNLDSSLLLSLGKNSSAGHVVVGFRPTSTVKLSDLIPSLPSGVDFSFPTFALVLAHPATSLTYADLLPDEQTFFQPFCGDAGSPCNTTLPLNNGLSIVAAVTMPSSLQGLLDSVHVDPSAPALVTGTLPIFGGPSNFALSVTLPSIPATNSIPDMFQSGQLSLQLTTTSLSLTGSMTFNIPKGHIGDAATCTSLGGVMRSARGTAEAAHCFDQVPFDVTTALTVSPPGMTLTGGLHSGYAWQAPLDVEWLSLNKATLELGVSVDATGPTFTLGFAIGATVANHDFLGAIKASISPTPNPPFFVINPQGFRISSNSGLSMQDLVDLGTAASGRSLTLGGVPNIAIRNVDLRWSETTDTALCLPQGLHIAGDLYINPSSSTAAAVAGCPDDSGTESNRTTACVSDASNGCFASVDIGIDDKGIHASGNLGAFTVGPISFGGALVDAELTSDVQRLLVKGGMTIQGFASGKLDLLVGATNLHFRGSVQLFGSAFDAFLDGDASINLAHLTDLTNPPAFSVKAVLKSDFLSQAGVALSGTLQTLKPAIQALDVVLGDISNNDILGAIVDVPAQVAKLGVSLPAPYGSALSTVSTKLSDIKTALSGFGHTVNWGLNDLLNGFTLSFPGIPGTIQPSSPTCVTDWVDGTCYSIPPACFGDLGCTDGVPGVVVYPTCIFTEVDGTCWSVPPITGVHIPGICNLLQQAIPSLTCNSSSLIDDLIMPALRSAFKQVTGYDIGNLTLSTVLDDITNALGSGSTVSIDCAEFDAHVGASNGAPSAGVSLATDLNLFGNHYNYGVSWNFSVNSGNAAKAILDIINSIIHPSTGNTCALPADWNSNANYVDVVGTAPNTGTTTPTPPVTPTMSLTPLSPVNEGGGATLNGAVSPAPSPAATVNVTWGDGSSSAATSGAGGTFTATHTYTNNTPVGQPAAQYAIHASVSGGPSASTMVTVRNVAPSNLVLTPSGASVNEGDSVTISGSFTDPGTADTHTVSIDWGDGGASSLTLAAGVTTFTSGSHTYADNHGSKAGYLVGVTVTDDDGASTTTTRTVNVANVAPNSIVITPSASTIPEKQVVTYSVGFADPGVNDTETVLVDWGDGSARESLSIGTARSLTMSHQWSEADTAAHPDGRFPVSVTVTDKDGGAGTATSTETVTNVAPNHLTLTAQPSTFNEGGTVTVGGNFADASGADTHAVTIDWGAGWGPSERSTTINLAAGVFGYSATRQYGDNGGYTITATVADDDGASTSTSTAITVNNVPPTALIDRSTTTGVQGTPTFLGHAQHAMSFSEHSTDPGSDDLTMLWNWADGSTTSTTYLNAPPNPDPALSPQVNPRDVVDTHSHTWAAPCVYNIGLGVNDDDKGTASDSNWAVITGNATARLSSGQWKQQYSGRGSLSPATLSCYLKIASYMSGVFGDTVTVNSSADAMNVLQPSSSDPHQLLDRELLVTWLNFANGLWDWNTLVDSNGDGIPDTAFNVVMSAAERTRTNPNATRQQLLNQRNLLNAINGDA